VAVRRRWRRLGLGAFAGAALYFVPGPIDLTAPPSLDRAAQASGHATRRVLLVSVDGLAPWVLAKSEAPTLARLAAEGTRADVAETVLPSITLTSHTSMISGLPPERHGVDWNRWLPWRHVTCPTLFTACGALGLRCGLVAGKVKFAHYAVDEPGMAHYGYGASAEEVIRLGAAWLRDGDPDFLMLHVAEVDTAGHRYGWGSEEQRAAIARVDALLARLVEDALAASPRPLALIVTADHGGHGTRHGSDDERDLRIPWLAWGDGVPRAATLPRVATTQTAATVLGLLGAAPDVTAVPGRSALAGVVPATAEVRP
jgi:predicted AlkP superfamily pyrophosphatase or phosphodiesterase